MPIGQGRIATKGRPLETMVHLKRSIVEVKTEENCLAHALIISIAKLTNDSDYKAYILPADSTVGLETFVLLSDMNVLHEAQFLFFSHTVFFLPFYFCACQNMSDSWTVYYVTRTEFKHHRMNMAGLTYSHCTSPDTYASRRFHTLYYNLYRHNVEKGQL
jgi:hypothetical protein